MAWRKTFAFGTDTWDPTRRFETSWILTPWLLFWLRSVVALYIFTTLFFEIAWQCDRSLDRCLDTRRSFSYFTTLTYWGLGFYFLFAATHTYNYARWHVPSIDHFPRPLQALHSLLYTTIVVLPFIVTIVYWAMLYQIWSTRFSEWSDVSKHLLNSVFALLEIVIPRTDPPPPLHMLWLVVILALYLAVAYITKAIEGFYTYNFLDPGEANGLVGAYVFGIAAGTLVVFGVVWCLIWLRRYVTETKLGATGRFPPGSKQAQAALPPGHEMSERV